MSKNEPIEFGENGAVLNTAHMTSDMRANYNPETGRSNVRSETVSFSGMLAGLLITAIGLGLLRYFDATLTAIQYWVFFILISLAAHQASHNVTRWRRKPSHGDRPEQLVL